MSIPTIEQLKAAQEVLDKQEVPRPHFVGTEDGWIKLLDDDTTERGYFNKRGKWVKES